jgi:DNA-binding response OmpR family regulator
MAKKILLVDDSTTMLLMERMVLGKGGYHLISANNGEEAVRSALTQNPDLILLDIVMPRMDGFEVCRRLRAHDVTRATPIILVTNRGEESHVEEGFRSGCNDFIMKPLDGLELLTKVKSLLGD